MAIQTEVNDMEPKTYLLLFALVNALVGLMSNRIYTVLSLMYPPDADDAEKRWSKWPHSRADVLLAHGVLCTATGLLAYAICGGVMTYAEILPREWVRQLIAGVIGVITGAMYYDYTVKKITLRIKEIDQKYNESRADKSPAWAAVV
jgi:hypothetical protein